MNKVCNFFVLLYGFALAIVVVAGLFVLHWSKRFSYWCAGERSPWAKPVAIAKTDQNRI